MQRFRIDAQSVACARYKKKGWHLHACACACLCGLLWSVCGCVSVRGCVAVCLCVAEFVYASLCWGLWAVCVCVQLRGLAGCVFLCSCVWPVNVG